MKITLLVKLFALMMLLGAAFAAQGQSPRSSDDSVARAKELWELAVAAKGGREALYKVTSIAEIRRPDGSHVRFVVLPDKYFSFYDMRPSIFGKSIELYNYESGFGYRTFTRDKRKVYQDIRTDPDFKTIKGRHVYLLYPQLYLLLETRWMQPKPLSASKARVNGKSADRVDVLIEGYSMPQRFAVFLDEKTHLPVRIALCRNVDTDEITDVCCFSNLRGYTEIAGVKIPLESTGQRDSTWDRKQIEINAEYDPQFFDRPPDHNAGGLQWRKAGAKPAPTPVTAQPEPLTPTQITQLIKDLDATDEELRQTALRDLATAGKQVVPALTEALTSLRSPMQRYNIVVILLKLDEQNPAATAALADLVTDVRLNPQARQDAAFGLLRNEPGIAALIGLLENSDALVRRCAIFAFDELTERAEIPRQVEKALPTLRRLLKDNDKIVRGMAKEVLEQVGDRFKR
ncbi:MAG: HEAT repeat domain-containing protein [Blastocatellales bacterium]